MSEPTGVLLIDKPTGITSADVVRQVKRKLGIRGKVGHAGTLDPLATGLVVVCVGQGTKLSGHFSGQKKSYVTTAKFGVVSDSYDSDGTVTQAYDGRPLERETVRTCVESFLGKSQQLPPMYSAVRVGGKRLHKLARQGIEVDRPSRDIEIFELVLEEYSWPSCVLRATVSKGTYIRSLVHDLGAKLGTGGVVTQLRRTASGHFSIEDAVTLEDVGNEHLRPLLSCITWPRVSVGPSVVERILNGLQLRWEQLEQNAVGEPAGEFVIVTGNGRMLAIASLEEGKLTYRNVFK